MLFKVVFIMSLMQYFALGELETSNLEDEPILKLLQNILDIPLDNKESPMSNNTGSLQNRTESPRVSTGPSKNNIDSIDGSKTPTKNDTKLPKGDTNTKPPKEALKPPNDNKKPPNDNKKPPNDNKMPPNDNKKPPNDNKKPPNDNKKPPNDNKKPPKDNPKSSKENPKSSKDSTVPPKDNTKPPKDTINPPKASTVSPKKLENNSTNDECPGDKSLHSKNDLKYSIDYVYNELSIDDKIRSNYHSKALQHRDNYLQRIKEYQDYLHDSPNHFKHVVASLSTIRKDIIERKLINAAQLLKENWELLNTYKERKKLFMRLIKKLSRYHSMCSFNCEESDYDEGHVVLRRSAPNVYYCSSLKDLHKILTQKLSEFEVIFNHETVNRFSDEDKKFRKKMEILKQNFKEKGLQNVVGAMFDILILQDVYHHLAESLKYSTMVTQLKLIRNLTLQADTEMFYLSNIIEQYGQHCRSCENELFRRTARQVVQMRNDKSYEKTLDTLISEKFNQTAILIQNDWDNIFRNVTGTLDENRNANMITKEFGKLNKEINEIIKQERQSLKNLESDVSLLKVEDWNHLVLKLSELILQIRKTAKEVSDLLNH